MQTEDAHKRTVVLAVRRTRREPDLRRRLTRESHFMALRIYRSNRLDALVALLGDVVSQPLSDPFAQETIMVSSLGMERWIVSELTRRFGVWTSAEHPLPRAFVERMLRSRALETPHFDRWDREHLRLSIADLLGDDSRIARWPTLHAYVQGTTRLERCIELADQIADAFDQYLVYRQDWIRAWEAGEGNSPLDDWQPDFFRHLVEQLGPNHFARRLDAALAELNQERPSFADWPERLCCFQVGLLPPSYLRLLQALARHIPVHFFVLSPSRAYVEYTRRRPSHTPDLERRDELRDAATSKKLAKRANPGHLGSRQLAFDFDDALHEGAPQHADVGVEPWERQPLFLSLCRQARQLESILGELHPVEIGAEPFVDVEPRTLLEHVQSEIYSLRHRPSESGSGLYAISLEDRSLSVHACHSPRREIECLREVLLDQFDRDPSLSPEDVLVMLTDVNEYSPLVDAVFGARHGEVGHIPYTIADRSGTSFNGLSDALLRLLELFAGRLTHSHIIDILSIEPLQSKFGILPDKLSRIERWLTDVHFSWGLDAADRRDADAPESEERSLRFGLDRLLLGVALDSKQAPVFRGRAPLDLEGEDAELAGRLAELCQACFGYRARLREEQSVDSYVTVLTALLDDLFSIDRDTAWQRTEICQRLHDFALVAQEAEFQRPLSFYTLRRELESRLDTIASARSFLSGGITFCKMLPLRSIPFRVIAMVGLDDTQFPRRERRSSFNALHRDDRVGDRRVSDEDRYLFAETLVACQERLIITYVGRSSRDDSALPPSVVVEDLLNAIEESCVPPKDVETVRKHIVHVEALQPFSPRYFDGSRPDLVCRSEMHFRAALALRSKRDELQTPDYSGCAAPVIERLEITDLVQLLRDPTRIYLEAVLHVARDLNDEFNEGTEPISLDGLAQWQVTQKLLAGQQEGLPASAIKERLRAAGELPILELGEVNFDALNSRAESLYSAAARFTEGDRLADIWISLDIANVRIEGTVGSTWQSTHLCLSPSRYSARRAVEAWIPHLCLNASGLRVQTAIVARSANGTGVETRILEPLEDNQAKDYLEQLVRDYRWSHGLPLPFWLDPGFEYESARNRQLDHQQALDAASECLEKKRNDGELPSQFEGLYGKAPLNDDWPERAQAPNVPSFAQWAHRWLGPIFEHMRELDSAGPESEHGVGR